MAKDRFNDAMVHVPEEQCRLLDGMMELELVENLSWDQEAGLWTIRYSRKGREFLKLVHSVCASAPDRRGARLIALEMLADKKIVIGGQPRK